MNLQTESTPDAPVVAATTSFNKNATEFVPRGKIVKTTESFPTLGVGITKEPVKKKAAPVVA